MQNKIEIFNALIGEIATGDKAWYLFDTRWHFFVGAFNIYLWTY